VLEAARTGAGRGPGPGPGAPPHHAKTERDGDRGLQVPFREVIAEIFVLLSVGSLLRAYNKTEDALLCASAVMRFLTLTFLVGTVVATSGVCSARNTSKLDCVSFAEARKHVGTTQCVSGTVLHVEDGSNGVTFLNFCKDYQACPFTVVVFPGDLRKVGNLRQLEGRQIEIKGTIQDYDGRAEIILRHTQQLGESAFVVVPPVPTDYDVERHGHYSVSYHIRNVPG
jgi:hypothetical protein